jgi:hypothetical protein
MTAPWPKKRAATKAELIEVLATLKARGNEQDAAIGRALGALRGASVELQTARDKQQEFYRVVFRMIEGAIATAPPEES